MTTEYIFCKYNDDDDDDDTIDLWNLRKCSSLQNNLRNSFLMIEKLKEVLSNSVIQESTSPWRHSLVVFGKVCGGKRLTFNYKPVNLRTTFDAYPFPNIEEL